MELVRELGKQFVVVTPEISQTFTDYGYNSIGTFKKQ
jgi:hypothetical protein